MRRAKIIACMMMIVLTNCDDSASLDGFDNIPDHILKQMAPTSNNPKFVGHDIELAWKKPVLTVSFEQGDVAVLALIEKTANEWTDIGGDLKFSFRNPDRTFRKWGRLRFKPKTDIRISFRSGMDGGQWSAVGTAAQNLHPNSPTMNLQGFNKKLATYLLPNTSHQWAKSEERSVILHEFGHALSLAHEHFHPDCQADMKIDAIVKYFNRKYEWKPKKSLFNISYQTYVDTMRAKGEIKFDPRISPKIDQHSIMLYSNIPKEHYRSGKNSPCLSLAKTSDTTSLSQGDRRYYLSHYTDL